MHLTLKCVLFHILLYVISCDVLNNIKTREELVESLKNVPHSDSTLIFAHVLFRHGARTPVPEATYPNDPHKYASFWPYGIGQLTKAGQYTAFKLGVELRKRYDSFLGPVYNKDIIDAFTSQKTRTEASVQCVLAGLFPPRDEDLFLTDLNWIPVTYFILPRGEILNPFDKCTNYWNLTSDFNDEITLKFRDYVSEHSGLTITNNTGFWFVKDTFEVTNFLGRKQPEWILRIYPQPLVEYALRTYDDLLAQRLRLGAYSIMRKITEDISRKLNGTMIPPRKKMILYSGHEQSLVYVLAVLNAFNREFPPFSAYVAIELHLINNIYGLKVYYQNYKSVVPKAMKILNHTDTFCPLDLFLDKIKWLINGPKPTCP